MSRQVGAQARSPLLAEKPAAIGRRRRRIGEVAGGTAAECAAVWCCCPCAAMNVLVLALYKVPAGLCRRALARRKKKKKKTATTTAKAAAANRQRLGERDGVLLRRGPGGPTGPSASSGGCGPTTEELEGTRNFGADVAFDVEEEEELWGRFSGSGFWRSPSQRDS